MQYGFRKGLSTIDVVSKLCKISDKAIEGKRQLYGTKHYCIVATLAAIDSKGLALAAKKTEVVLISSRKKGEAATIKIGEAKITPRLKYLGVMIDHQLSLKEHQAYTSGKASRNTAVEIVTGLEFQTSASYLNL